jgi:hypothetical protein
MHARWAADAKEPVDLVRVLNHTTFDIMSDLCFGEPLDLLVSTRHHYWVDANLEGLKELAMSRVFRYYPWTSILAPLVLPRVLLAKLESNFRLCMTWVDRRLAAGTVRPDVCGTIMEMKEDLQFTRPELYANVQTLMLAGTETTAGLLCGTLYYLLSHPATLARLTSEIRGAFPDAREITLDALAKLGYLEACIEEGLRMFPPAPVGLPRILSPGGRRICGEWVPGKVGVLPGHRDSRTDRKFPRLDAGVGVHGRGRPEPAQLRSAGRLHSGTMAVAGPRVYLGSPECLPGVFLWAPQLCGEKVGRHRLIECRVCWLTWDIVTVWLTTKLG